MYSNDEVNGSTLTLILAGGHGKRLSPFTAAKAKPLVSFGGVFRIMDFTLSNCVHSGIQRAYLLTQYKAESIRHDIEYSSWPVDFVCVPPQPLHSYRGTADSVYKNMDLFCHDKAEYVLILAADHIYKMDYRRLIRFHASHGGDATIAAVPYPKQLAGQFGVLETDDHDRVVGFEEKPQDPRPRASDPSTALANMGVYVFNAATLRKALLRDAGNFSGSHEFGNDILPNLVRTDRVFAYDFAKHNVDLGSFWRDVGTIDSYFRAQMELLLVNSVFDPFDPRWQVYSRGVNASFRNEGMDPPWVVDSAIAPGAKISGATIRQSILSPSVSVAPTAEIIGSVLMPGVTVGRDARIQHAIIGEDVVIPDGDRIGCDFNEDRRRFHVSENGVVSVPGPGFIQPGVLRSYKSRRRHSREATRLPVS
jgi:glucose-1-phosphate adenylyltransferase